MARLGAHCRRPARGLEQERKARRAGTAQFVREQEEAIFAAVPEGTRKALDMLVEAGLIEAGEIAKEKSDGKAPAPAPAKKVAKKLNKKKARRYAEQDEEDRELAMHALGHAKPGNKLKDKLHKKKRQEGQGTSGQEPRGDYGL